MEEKSESFKTVERETTEELEKLTISKGEEELKNSKNIVREGKIKLKSGDGVIFDVKEWMAKEMQTVQNFIEAASVDTDSSIVIPLHNVSSQDLDRIIKYWSKRRLIGSNVKELRQSDERFVANMSLDEMKELLLAASYLNMNSFFEMISAAIAKAIENKSVEFVREFFGIVSDYTPEEEEEYREANAWAFEGVDKD